MTPIPQGACAMREIVTTTADEAAHATRVVQRISPLGGATVTQTLVLGFLGTPQASLEARTQTAATWARGNLVWGPRLSRSNRSTVGPMACCSTTSGQWRGTAAVTM